MNITPQDVVVLATACASAVSFAQAASNLITFFMVPRDDDRSNVMLCFVFAYTIIGAGMAFADRFLYNLK